MIKTSQFLCLLSRAALREGNESGGGGNENSQNVKNQSIRDFFFFFFESRQQNYSLPGHLHAQRIREALEF